MQNNHAIFIQSDHSQHSFALDHVLSSIYCDLDLCPAVMMIKHKEHVQSLWAEFEMAESVYVL